jgi:hypothetical protein
MGGIDPCAAQHAHISIFPARTYYTRRAVHDTHTPGETESVNPEYKDSESTFYPRGGVT